MGVEVLLITKKNCPLCDLAKQVWGKYLNNGIREVDIDDLPPEIDRQVYEGEEKKRVPMFAVLLHDGNVLMTARAVPSLKELAEELANEISEDLMEKIKKLT
ncbi:MAG TPA: hypothetical protein ENF26_01000 [Methanomicrobia archaeon]|nr:hypothetical protein [Methanomicrobia archaeon]HEX58709.1 hypothetical protein [Methanomicrobia archaeon]